MEGIVKKMKFDLSIVIPVYNEEDNVEQLCHELDGYLGRVALHAELIFVDDGSQDNSVEKLKQKKFHNASVKIIKLSKNFGAHAALRAGLQNATTDFCMIYFMDMQDPLEMIETFYQKLHEGYDIAYEKRKNYKAGLGSRIFGRLVQNFIQPDYPEEGVSCFMVNRKVLNELNKNIESNSSLYFQLFSLGFRKVGLLFECKERTKGKSGWTFSKKVKLLTDSFVTFSKAPLRLVMILGTIMAVVGFVWALVIALIKIFNLMSLNAGWPTLIAVILLGFGVTNLSISIIAEYLWRTLEAARKRPVFIVDEIIENQGEES